MTDRPVPRIVAVVVTFNRLALLQRLVARLRETESLAAEEQPNRAAVVDRTPFNREAIYRATRGYLNSTPTR